MIDRGPGVTLLVHGFASDQAWYGVEWTKKSRASSEAWLGLCLQVISFYDAI